MIFFTKFFEPHTYNEGFLPTIDGHQVWYGEYGNPKGKVVLCTHGGPGGGTRAGKAKDFDLKKIRVIMFDQRGCGKSLPLGAINHNTTQTTLYDMERLLTHLQISDKIILRGGSWSSALSLLFAIKHPDKVSKLILNSIFLARQTDLDWELKESYRFYPDIFEEIHNSVPKGEDFFEYFKELINSNSIAKQRKAIKLYAGYERCLGILSPQLSNPTEISPKQLAYSKIYINYSANNLYLKDNEILKNIKKIAHIPALLVHNRLDFVCPLNQAYELHKKMPRSKLIIVPDSGHGSKMLNHAIKSAIRSNNL